MTRKGDTVQTGCLPKDGLNQVELVCKGHVWKGEIPTCVEGKFYSFRIEDGKHMIRLNHAIPHT